MISRMLIVNQVTRLPRRLPCKWRRIWAGAIGGYLGINAAALIAGLMFGAQPHLAYDAAGRALYCPYGFSIAVPAMLPAGRR